LEIAQVHEASARIRQYIRRTPLVQARPLKNRPPGDSALYLKLESLQITGSFKARGAVNKLFSLPPEQVSRGIVTASGGNHGLGVAYAGWLSGAPATIYLPHNTPPVKAHKLAGWGANVIMEGEVWDDANRAALLAAGQEGLTYFHPFADHAVIAGQGTIALEILEDLPDPDIVLVAIGGGGLISGVSFTLKTLYPSAKVIGVEPVGAPTLQASLEAGKLVELPEITTAANTLAPRRSAEINYELISRNVDDIVLVTDEEMRQAARWLWQELGIAAELSGAAALAALLSEKISVAVGQKVVALVCGVGTDGLD
jgi:threonine dehydratase